MVDRIKLFDSFWASKLLFNANYVNTPQLKYDCAQITNRLFIGSMRSIESDSLLFHNFDAIINVSSEIEIVETIKNFIQINIDDSNTTFICDYFDKVNSFIDANKKVLIHCAAGISRSASFVIAYLVRMHKFCLVEAIKYIKCKRAIILPNDGFIVQLILYEIYILQNLSQPITISKWRDAMNLLYLDTNICDDCDDDLPREWKNLYQLGFSSKFAFKHPLCSSLLHACMQNY